VLSAIILFPHKSSCQFGGQRFVSPEVRSDKTATFRITARDAKTVILVLLDIKINHAMEKNEYGLWSVTISPLEPDIYAFVFRVNGTHTVYQLRYWDEKTYDWKLENEEIGLMSGTSSKRI